MKILMKGMASALAFVMLATVMLISGASAAGEVTVSSTAITTISLATEYSDFTSGGNAAKIYVEKTLCPEPYFDNVRVGDTISVQIKVGAAGTYKMCLVTGWGEGFVCGRFNIKLDGANAAVIDNKVSGKGWRTWLDTTETTIDLPAGNHTVTIECKSDGPNIQGLKFSPENIEISEKTGYINLYTGGTDNAAQIDTSYSVQFNSSLPLSEISIVSPSYNNDVGSLRLSLYPWLSSYDSTLRGKAVATHDFIDFKDNATLTLKADGYADAGEYLLYVENISSEGEQVGIWTGFEKFENVRNYKNDAVTEVCARVTIKYLGENISLGALSAVCENEVDKTPSDLYPDGAFARYAMEENDKYGVQFKTDAPFGGCEVYIPSSPQSGGTLTLSLYKWAGNYAKTISVQPIAEQSFSDVSRGSWVTLTAESGAGEYLFTVTKGAENMQVSLVETADPNTTLYVNCAGCNISLVSRLVGFEGALVKASVADANEYISSGSWVATDGLGREVTTADAEGKTKQDKYVGIFYHTWHSSHYRNTSINATEIISKYPEARNDYSHPAWKGITTCFWDEPIWGYYNNGVDRWVLRKQAELLADAGVDVVIFDNTNGTENYISGINELCEVWAEARADGVKTPGISAMLNMFDYDAAAVQIRELYNVFYSKGLYKDLWFNWEGKPLLVGAGIGLDENDENDKKIFDFFTYRPINPCYTETYVQLKENGIVTTSWQPSRQLTKNYTLWKWISVYPQQKMYKLGEKEQVEEMCVCIAENWSDDKGLTAMNSGLPGLYGRAYSVKNGGLDTSEDAILYGANFTEQFEYALECDPKFIYITGWNEWVAGRYEEMWGTENAIPDNATAGYSRDIEPSNGVLKDHYYYLMVSYIRKFKGVDASAVMGKPNKIDITLGAEQWDSISPEYKTYGNNILVRDYKGYNGFSYSDSTGRNDIVSSKVTYDSDNVYFMVRTANEMTKPDDSAWMRLFIDTTGAAYDGWETFDYLIACMPDGKANIDKSTGGWSWQSAGQADYSLFGDTLQIAVPRSTLGITGDDFTFSFKWADNTQSDGDILDFYKSGDVAPGGRFKYSFVSSSDVSDSTTAVTDRLTTDNGEEEEPDVTDKSINGALIGGIVGATVLAAGGIAAAVTISNKKKHNKE